MAKKFFGIGMLVMVLAFGMSIVGCDNGTTSNATTVYELWVSGNNELRLRNGSFETATQSDPMARGLIATTGNIIIFHVEQLYANEFLASIVGISSGWYTMDEMVVALQNSSLIEEVIIDNYFVNPIRYDSTSPVGWNFAPAQGTISGNTISLGNMVFTRMI